jgi:hypothetical protein
LGAFSGFGLRVIVGKSEILMGQKVSVSSGA